MEDQEQPREIKRFSRRSAIKVIGGLFAFVPAVKYLASASDVFAYVPCDDPSHVSCYWQTVCADPNCRGWKTWWKFEYCTDTRNGQNCPSYQSPPVDTGSRCS
jgi:hypothetical protein